jgi:hypothetical protein
MNFSPRRQRSRVLNRSRDPGSAGRDQRGHRERLSGRQAWRLLWESSKPLSAGVLAWAALDAVDGPLVVAALGFVVGAIPDAVRDGMSSPAGHRLIAALVIAALLYTMSLVLDPIGGALSTASRQRVTGQLQARLLTAVNAPAGIAHLEDRRPGSPTWRTRRRSTGSPAPRAPSPATSPATPR